MKNITCKNSLTTPLFFCDSYQMIGVAFFIRRDFCEIQKNFIEIKWRSFIKR